MQEDSIALWRQVCQNPLLSKTTLILFLNKVSQRASYPVSAPVPGPLHQVATPADGVDGSSPRARAREDVHPRPPLTRALFSPHAQADQASLRDDASAAL